MEMPRKIVAVAALFVAGTLGSAPRSAPAQSSYFHGDTEVFMMQSGQRQEWVNDMQTVDCAGECPGRGCCTREVLPM